MTILITGARGSIARSLIEQLRSGGIDYKIASRTPMDRAAVVDFTRPETIAPALEGVDKIFLYAAEGLDNLVSAARQADVQHLALVSSASVVDTDKVTNPIAAHHLQAERVLQESGIPWTLLRPGAFATNDLAWADSIKSTGVVRIAYPDAYLTVIHEADIADVAYAALTEDGHQAKVYVLTGPESLTQRRQAEQIGETVGRQIRVEALDRAKAERFMPSVVLDMFEAAQAGPGRVGPCSVDITGRPSRSFKQWAVDHASDFR